ncbi:CHAT domain-containing protein [Nocardia sp. NPDC051463]|uniref:CHAT domain-containing protein n=1 Tax=Nocardia sp. NPDC051463 TaxID=3154845 RepID=UPI0034155353
MTEPSSIAALAIRIIDTWPSPLSLGALSELTRLRAVDSKLLVDEIIRHLPRGPLGATEARRLRMVVSIIDALAVAPDDASLEAMRSRYRERGRVPLSVKRVLADLEQRTSREAGTLSGDEMPRRRLRRSRRRSLTESTAERVERLDIVPPIQAASDTAPHEERFFHANLEDHDNTQPLRLDEQYTIAFDVGSSSNSVTVEGVWPEDVFVGADTSINMFALTVQLDSPDFEILGPRTRPLRLPRTGPSRGKARFEIAAVREGLCQLIATTHLDGNFVSQMKLTLQVGGSAPASVNATMTGRPPESVTALEPRDICLVIEPAPASGYLCRALGSVGNRAVLPITVGELTDAAETVRKALLKVVTLTHDRQLVFQHQVTIPERAQRQALELLAPAGARLFQRVFLHPGAGEDARAVGEWLKEYATDPAIQLELQVFAERLPIPWACLYLGETSDGAQLDWNNFLGLRHIVEQLPLQTLRGSKQNAIESRPALEVSLNINQMIDTQMGITLVAEHQSRWNEIAAARSGLKLFSRSTRDDVFRALRNGENRDKLIYFFCHATGPGPDGDPDLAAFSMGDGESATLADLNRNASTDSRLPERPLVFINACDSANLSPRFYDGFVPYFMAKGARGVIGTECKTPVLFGIRWAETFLEKMLDGASLGEAVLGARRMFLEQHNNPLGLLYTVHCDVDTRVSPPLPRTEAAD